MVPPMDTVLVALLLHAAECSLLLLPVSRLPEANRFSELIRIAVSEPAEPDCLQTAADIIELERNPAAFKGLRSSHSHRTVVVIAAKPRAQRSHSKL